MKQTQDKFNVDNAKGEADDREKRITIERCRLYNMKLLRNISGRLLPLKLEAILMLVQGSLRI